MYSLTPFISGSSAPRAGERLVKVWYKNTEKRKARFPSVCVSIPPVTEIEEENLDALLPFVVEMLQETQDKIIKSLYESSAGVLRTLEETDISTHACISYLSAQRNPLTPESVKAWFEKEIQENLTVLLAEKLGYGEIPEEGFT